jgi:hypothetical protein
MPDTTPKTPDVPKNRRLLNIARTHVSFPRPLVAPTDEAFYVRSVGGKEVVVYMDRCEAGRTA